MIPLYSSRILLTHVGSDLVLYISSTDWAHVDFLGAVNTQLVMGAR